MTAPYLLEIAYQDADVVVIHKPAGLLVHRSYLARKEQWFAMQLLRDQIGQKVYPVHRLDRPTSGLLLFALSAAVARALSQQFAEQTVERGYHTVVRGYLDNQGTITAPLSVQIDKYDDERTQVNKAAQSACSHYQCLKQIELPFAVGKRYATSRYSLAKVWLETGRKHQIRRHFAHLRHPIIGDTRYGDGRHNQFFRTYFGIEQLLLAATSLSFIHPIKKQPIEIKWAVPEALTRVFDEPSFKL